MIVGVAAWLVLFAFLCLFDRVAGAPCNSFRSQRLRIALTGWSTGSIRRAAGLAPAEFTAATPNIFVLSAGHRFKSWLIPYVPFAAAHSRMRAATITPVGRV
jgi:hypothetical protein